MKSRWPDYQAGLSIIELMIALLLGLLLLGGVLQIFLSTQRTYQTNAGLSQLQEAGRFALEFIAFDLRNAGYRGECLSTLNDLTPASFQTADKKELYTLGSGINGWRESKLPAWLKKTNGDSFIPLADTDLILLKHAANPAATVTKNASSTTDTLSIKNAPTLSQGNLLIVGDPLSCDFFSTRSNDKEKISLADNKTFSRNYSDTAQVLFYQSALYFLQAGSQGAPPALRRVRYTATTDSAPTTESEELVSGIMQLKIKYAVGNGSGQISGDYMDADKINDWSSVIAARVSLIAVSRQTNVVTPDQTIEFDGNPAFPIPNGRLGQAFSLTVSIRNHLP